MNSRFISTFITSSGLGKKLLQFSDINNYVANIFIQATSVYLRSAIICTFNLYIAQALSQKHRWLVSLMCNQFKDTLIDGIVGLGFRFSLVAKYFIGKIIVWAMHGCVFLPTMCQPFNRSLKTGDLV